MSDVEHVWGARVWHEKKGESPTLDLLDVRTGKVVKSLPIRVHTFKCCKARVPVGGPTTKGDPAAHALKGSICGAKK